MTYIDTYSNQPCSIRLKGTTKGTNLLVKGQGVFIFKNTDNSKPCEVLAYNSDATDGYKLILTSTGVTITRISTNDTYVDSTNKSGLVDTNGAYYWFSIDAQNQTLRIGVGEARVETIIYSYTFLFVSNDDRKANKKFIESLEKIQISDTSTAIQPIKLLRDPVTNTIAAIVKDTSELSMNDVASGTYLPKANLSLEAQQLYDCISGKKFVLDSDDFPDFTQAIEYSIKTPGCWCNKRLEEKSTEFNKDKPNPLETYLRITIGQNNGESPGIPYVMEIWPVGHYSPIHNHSGANAIIRVLNGEITVSQFPYLSASVEGVNPFAVTNFHKDQITWISPTLNQTHQLRNLPENAYTCITIQCYLYDTKDKSHYDYFDYIDVNGDRQQYEPDSDMDFVKFKQTMKDEWNARTKPRKMGLFQSFRKFLRRS
jgi:hypothetical protein